MQSLVKQAVQADEAAEAKVDEPAAEDKDQWLPKWLRDSKIELDRSAVAQKKVDSQIKAVGRGCRDLDQNLSEAAARWKLSAARVLLAKIQEKHCVDMLSTLHWDVTAQYSAFCTVSDLARLEMCSATLHVAISADHVWKSHIHSFDIANALFNREGGFRQLAIQNGRCRNQCSMMLQMLQSEYTRGNQAGPKRHGAAPQQSAPRFGPGARADAHLETAKLHGWQNLVALRLAEWKAKSENRRRVGEMTAERMKRLLVVETLSMMVYLTGNDRDVGFARTLIEMGTVRQLLILLENENQQQVRACRAEARPTHGRCSTEAVPRVLPCVCGQLPQPVTCESQPPCC